MTAANLDLTIEQGKTFNRILRWEAGPLIYKPITAIAQAAPAPVTAVAHGMPNGWRAAIVSVLGMLQINATSSPPRLQDFRQGTVIDDDTVSFNSLNAAGFSPYISGGYLVYNTPVPLAGYSARMSIKDKIGGTELLRLDTTNGRIALDDTASTISLVISAVDTAALALFQGVYDLELASGSGVVTALIQGSVIVTPEVTTT